MEFFDEINLLLECSGHFGGAVLGGESNQTKDIFIHVASGVEVFVNRGYDLIRRHWYWFDEGMKFVMKIHWQPNDEVLRKILGAPVWHIYSPLCFGV